MKRRGFLRALLGAVATVPFMPKLANAVVGVDLAKPGADVVAVFRGQFGAYRNMRFVVSERAASAYSMALSHELSHKSYFEGLKWELSDIDAMRAQDAKPLKFNMVPQLKGWPT